MERFFFGTTSVSYNSGFLNLKCQIEIQNTQVKLNLFTSIQKLNPLNIGTDEAYE